MGEQVHDPNRRQWYEFSRDGDAMIVTIRVAPGGDGPRWRSRASSATRRRSRARVSTTGAGSSSRRVPP